MLQNKVNNLLKERWSHLTDDDKVIFREWTEWDKKRYAHDLAIFQNRRSGDDDDVEAVEDDMQEVHIPKKRKNTDTIDPVSIPKKTKS